MPRRSEGGPIGFVLCPGTGNRKTARAGSAAPAVCLVSTGSVGTIVVIDYTERFSGGNVIATAGVPDPQARVGQQ